MSKLLIANWKANKNIATAQQWFQDFSVELTQALNGKTLSNQVVIAPSFPLLGIVRTEIDRLNHTFTSTLSTGSFELGVQDISPFGAGAYTGAVSGQNIAWLQPTTIIVGHSERRRYFQETSQMVASKVDQVLDLPARPVVCVDRDKITEQARALSAEWVKKLTIAYEPVEAIGTGIHPGVKQVQTVIQEIREAFTDKTPVLYGGSVDEQTVAEYLLVSDGVIVGTAAVDGKQFARVVAAAQP